MLQPPGVLPVILHVLQGGPGRGVTSPLFFSFSARESPQRGCRSWLPAGPQARPAPQCPSSTSAATAPAPQARPAPGTQLWLPTVPRHSPDTVPAFDRKEVTPKMGPGHRHHGVTEASLLHLGPGMSALLRPLKIPCFLQSSCQNTSPPTPLCEEQTPGWAPGSKNLDFSLQTISQWPGMHLDEIEPKRVK